MDLPLLEVSAHEMLVVLLLDLYQLNSWKNFKTTSKHSMISILSLIKKMHKGHILGASLLKLVFFSLSPSISCMCFMLYIKGTKFYFSQRSDVNFSVFVNWFEVRISIGSKAHLFTGYKWQGDLCHDLHFRLISLNPASAVYSTSMCRWTQREYIVQYDVAHTH